MMIDLNGKSLERAYAAALIVSKVFVHISFCKLDISFQGIKLSDAFLKSAEQLKEEQLMPHFSQPPLAGLLALNALNSSAGLLEVDTASMPSWYSIAAFASIHGGSDAVDSAIRAPGTLPFDFVGYVSTPRDFVHSYEGIETGLADLSQISVPLTGPREPTFGYISRANASGARPEWMRKNLLPTGRYAKSFNFAKNDKNSLPTAF